MENILTKALDEVLTPRYSDELRDSYDTGYAVTAGFEEKMRELIRKTDRPPIKWKSYAMAAAAAVIAIAGAVIVPVIMNNRVEVSPPETPDNTSSVTITADESGTETTDGSMGILSDDSDSITPPPMSVEDPVTDDSEDDSENTTVTVSEAIEEAAPVPVESSASSDMTADSVPSENAVVEEPEGEVEEEECEDEEEQEDNMVINPTDSHSQTGDAGANDEPDGEDENPELCIENDKDDDSPNAPYDDEPEIIECEEEEDITIPDEPKRIVDADYAEGTKLSEIFSDKFGVSFDELWARSGKYCDISGGKNGDLNIKERDLPFMHEFVHKLGNAEMTNTDIPDGDTEYISIRIADVHGKPYQRQFYNASAWLNYKNYFGIIEDYDEEPVEEPAEEEDPEMFEKITFTVNVYRRSGLVVFNQDLLRYESGKYVHYTFKKQYRMPAGDVNTLFAETDKLFFPKTAMNTAGELASAMGIGADTISKAVVDIGGIFDTDIGSASIGSDYISGLFSKYSGRKLSQTAEYHIPKGVAVTVDLKNKVRLVIDIDKDGKVYVYDGIKQFFFTVSENEIVEAVNAVSRANGIKIPVYSTLGEYLNSKNFGKINAVSIGTVNESGQHGTVRLGELYDNNSGTLEKLADMIKSEFNNAKYISEYKYMNYADIVISVDGYSSQIKITKDDRFVIWTISQNVFKLSDGFYEKFKKVFLADKSKVFEYEDDIDEYDMPEKEPIDEDEIIDDSDVNPRT